jgi:hypothetical protein
MNEGRKAGRWAGNGDGGREMDIKYGGVPCGDANRLWEFLHLFLAQARILWDVSSCSVLFG